MEPVYTNLDSEDSFVGEVGEDEEKLLTGFHQPLASRSRTSLSRCVWSWLGRKLDSGASLPQKCASFQQLRGCLLRNTLVVHLSLILMYSILCSLIICRFQQAQGCYAVIYTPAQQAISREAKVLSVKINQTTNIFSAEPSPQVDDAWASLFRYANIRIKKEEVENTGRPSIQLSDGSGDYFGTLDVYHQLHCLKYIRQYVHQDYYTVRDTNVPVKDHVNHCIEMLRQIVMCKADTALMTYEWLPDFPGPWPNFGIQHECVNWEKIDNWSKQRSIDIFDPIYLHHPKFGFSYGKHHGNSPDHSD